MTFAWKRDEVAPQRPLPLMQARYADDYPSERIGRYRLACGHLMGCYDREHSHQVRKHSMSCDEGCGWSEIVEQVA